MCFSVNDRYSRPVAADLPLPGAPMRNVHRPSSSPAVIRCSAKESICFDNSVSISSGVPFSQIVGLEIALSPSCCSDRSWRRNLFLCGELGKVCSIFSRNNYRMNVPLQPGKVSDSVDVRKSIWLSRLMRFVTLLSVSRLIVTSVF